MNLETSPPPVDSTKTRIIINLRSHRIEEIELVLALVEALAFRAMVWVETTAEIRAALRSREGDAGQAMVLIPEGVAPIYSLLARVEAFSAAESANTAILRINFGAGELDPVRKRILKGFLHSVINDATLAGATQSFSDHPRIGLLLPLELPRSSLESAEDADLASRLAKTLDIAETHFRESYYFPHALYFLRGAVLNGLAQRYLPIPAGDTKLALAMELGIMALCKSLDFDVVEARPTRKPVDPGATASAYAGQVLQLPGKSGRHIEHRATPNPAPAHSANLPGFIAYYLPQFHPIPENDNWWGKGFTEWTNVSKAVPRFIGHEQPHLPGELGFYDLRLKEVLQRQIELARQHGIHGFCFYYYWFNGKRLLEAPLRNLLDDPALDFPFCLCWANENWTRAWDGQEREILMEQSHSPRDDLQFIKAIQPYLADPRYIRIDGKPLLLVYRASLLDDARATAKRWRDYCRNSGIGEIYLAAVLSFDIKDPRPFGFDAAVEFPPHRLSLPAPINYRLDLADTAFEGTVYDYPETVHLEALAHAEPAGKMEFPLFRGVMASWDNDARRPGRSRIFHHAAPTAYAHWLRLAALEMQGEYSAPFVFINAWNEWAEGTHLEPDRRFGYGYLAATADTLRLFDEKRLAESTPPELGFSTPASHLLPPHLIPRREASDLRLYRERLKALGQAPSFRVLLAFGELEPCVFDTLFTLAEQCYRDFELSVVGGDDFSAQWAQPKPARFYRCADLLAGLNQAAGESGEEWLVFMATGDQLFPHSLIALAEFIAANPGLQLIHTDELAYENDREKSSPVFKPDLNIALLGSTPYLGGLLLIRRSLFVELGGFRAGMEGAQEYDLALRVLDHCGPGAIGHLPEILAWRRLDKRPGADRPDLPAHEAKHRALSDHVARRGLDAEVRDGNMPDCFRVHYRHATSPKVTIIIPTRDQLPVLQRCIDSLLAGTTYPDYELLLIDNASTAPEAREFLSGLAALDTAKIRVFSHFGPFNYALMNNLAAREARGEYLLLLNNDTAVLQGDWLEVMMGHAQCPDVGIVGPRLVFPDGRIQHAGVVLGLNGVADFPWRGAGMEFPGQLNRLQVDQDVAAVTGACLLIRRSVFETAGGMDEQALPVAFGDFDLCLKVRKLGFRIVWTPHATLMHEAGKTLREAMNDSAAAARESERYLREQAVFLKRWKREIARDGAYNPNLSLHTLGFEPEKNSELARDPIYWHPLPTVFALPGDMDGSGHYRVIQPAQAAGAAGLARARIVKGYPQPIVLERLEIDTLFSQRQVDDAQLAALENYKSLLSCKIVMDFDDLLTHVPKSSHHSRHVWKDMEPRLRRLCALSDRVTVSTEALAQHMRAYHDEVRIMPNALDPVAWSNLAPARRQSDRPRVGWVGGVSHAGDLALIREVVRELADEVEWVFMGMCLDDMKPHLTEFHRGVPFAQYPARMAELNLDLALAPLESNAFNDCKSNLRLLEYGILGIPVIATDITPYQCGLPVSLVKNHPREWIKAIRDHVNDLDEAARRGDSLRQAVESDWMLDSRLEEWVKAWSGW